MKSSQIWHQTSKDDLIVDLSFTLSLFLLTDRKPFFCEHCDFHCVDASLLRSHLLQQHQDYLSPYSKHSTIVNNFNQSGSKASRYMDYLRNRSAMLSQPYWNPYTCPLIQDHKTETPVEVTGQGQSDTGSLLNLSSSQASEGENAMTQTVKTEGLVKHQCPYCAHTSTYLEVLWIHQRIAHRVDGSSSVAPKWAPFTNSPKSLKASATPWRRTGPPPFLEGKDCPSLPTPRTQRTQPPGVPTQTSSKHSAPKTQAGVPKPKVKDSRSSDGTKSSGRAGVLPQKKSGDHNQVADGGSKSSQLTSSSSTVQNKSAPNFQSTCRPKYKSHRAAVEASFPQEGLGFMLARNHGGTPSNASDRHHSRRQSCDSSSGQRGPDLWTAMNMWGHKAYLEPLQFAQGKNEATGEMPVDIDVLSLLKNYTPQDLAALYQHWGFMGSRIDPQGKRSM